MSIKTFLLSSACTAALVLGFSFTSKADDPCTECWLACDQAYTTCMQGGQYTPAQCRASLNTCRFFTCGNCDPP